MNKIKVHTASRDEKIRIEKRLKNVLEKERKIVFAFLYGSFLTESFFRDIDVGIFVKDLPSADYFDYEFELSQKLKKAIESPYEVDVKIINDAPLSFRFHVIRGEVLCCSNTEITDDYIISTARAYFDIAPLRHRYILET